MAQQWTAVTPNFYGSNQAARLAQSTRQAGTAGMAGAFSEHAKTLAGQEKQRLQAARDQKADEFQQGRLDLARDTYDIAKNKALLENERLAVMGITGKEGTTKTTPGVAPVVVKEGVTQAQIDADKAAIDKAEQETMKALEAEAPGSTVVAPELKPPVLEPLVEQTGVGGRGIARENKLRQSRNAKRLAEFENAKILQQFNASDAPTVEGSNRVADIRKQFVEARENLPQVGTGREVTPGRDAMTTTTGAMTKREVLAEQFANAPIGSNRRAALGGEIGRIDAALAKQRTGAKPSYDLFYDSKGTPQYIQKGDKIPPGYMDDATYRAKQSKKASSGGEKKAYDALADAVTAEEYGGKDATQARKNIRLAESMGVPANLMKDIIASVKGETVWDDTLTIDEISKHLPNTISKDGTELPFKDVWKEAQKAGIRYTYDKKGGYLRQVPTN